MCCNVPNAMMKAKEKLQQIEQLVERQKTSETLKQEERVKVTLKSTLINQLAKLEAEQQNITLHS